MLSASGGFTGELVKERESNQQSSIFGVVTIREDSFDLSTKDLKIGAVHPVLHQLDEVQ